MDIKSTTLTNVFVIGIFALLAYLIFSDRNISLEMGATENDRTIAVSGESETFVRPDTASVSFAITKKASTTDVATNSVNERMDGLIKQLKSNKVEEKDIKTTNYSVRPEYSYNDGKQVFEGYRVTQNITVVIRDLDSVSGVLATVNSAGVDNVSQLSLYVDETDEIMDKLREEAIDDAKKNAKKLAKELGVSLDQIVGYGDHDGSDNTKSMYRSEMAFAEADMEGAPAVVPTGENQFKANVTVTYKID